MVYVLCNTILVMVNIETFRITKENKNCVNEVCEKRGDKSKIFNDALKEYFLKRIESI